MTELAPLTNHADLQLTSAPTFAPAPPPTTNGHSPPVEDIQEDDSVIRCFCGISEDDGHTVYCEVCSTWQHILCYYPDLVVPELHVCVVCDPRPFNKQGALDRQQQKRMFATTGERKLKKAPSKSHKKKVKDVNSHSVQTNGWISGTETIERESGSPRELGPPSKKPKTNHRSSVSTSHIPTGHARKRAGSTTMNGQSPTKSPRSNSPEGYTGDYYSPEFMRSQYANFHTVEDNSYASISVSNDLPTWLNDTEALQDISPSLTQKDVFHRWDRPIEALKQTSPGVVSCRREDPNIIIHGQRPVHRWLEASTACDRNTYIGELNGHIGRVEDYVQDPRNRWDELRHPEPFVFFHDRLPIYVDCREEGSVLRYVGRSCQPNVKLQIIIHGTDFHFCFISLREIDAGEELTVPWHIRDTQLRFIQALNANEIIRPEEEAAMASWFTNVLANFGGCACKRMGPHVSCNMGRFDLRNKDRSHFLPSKTAKSRKTKRLPTQLSPGSTGQATNSRAGSEAVIQGDNDEEMADSRSISADSRSKPSSRDITPMMGVDGLGLGVTMSDRERRKLLQQEKLFEKMELGEQTGGRKGKRHSGGSALNTPNLSTSVRRNNAQINRRQTNRAQKQLGFPDSLNPSPTSVTGGSSTRPRTNGTSRTPNGTTVHRPRPEMSTFSTQTEGDVEAAPSPSPPRRRAIGSHVNCLLRRVQLESRRRKERSESIASQHQAKESLPTSPVVSKAEPPPSPILTLMPPPPPPPPPPSATPEVSTMSEAAPPPIIYSMEEPSLMIESRDVEMEDAPHPTEDTTHDSAQPSPTFAPPDMEMTEAPVVQTVEPPSESPSDPPTEPSAPPWQPPPWQPPMELSPTEAPQTWVESPATTSHPNLHVTLPPVPTFTTTAAPTSPGSAGGSDNVTGTARTQSPGPLPILSPTVQNSVQPSPMKKKMSLSDYLGAMKKRKKHEASAAQAQVQTTTPTTAKSEDDTKAGSEEVIEEVDMPLLPPAAPVSEDGEVKDEPVGTAAATTS